MKVYHLNCLHIASAFGSAIGHCLLLEGNNGLTLIDSGIGLAETREPEKRLGKELIETVGFKLTEENTAIYQIQKLGYHPKEVKNIICSHFDPDHIGGLADFPEAIVHTSKEEYDSFNSGNERYLPQQLSHSPEVRVYERNDSECFGLPARKLDMDFDVYLIPLFGHTPGHCGVAFENEGKWTFYVGDAYYLRAELTNKDHPVDQLATIRAVDNALRIKSLDSVRKVVENYGDTVAYFGYHDPDEFTESYNEQ